MVTGRFLILTFCVFGLGACSTGSNIFGGEAPVKSSITVNNNMNFDKPATYSAAMLNNVSPAAGYEFVDRRKTQVLSAREDKSHCRLKDRFDRKELIAYNFSDGQTRLALKADVDGFSLSDAGNFDVQEVKLKFRYRFQEHKKKKERCLYGSAWQGLLGSGYNELYERESNTVYEELGEEIDDIQYKVGKIF